MSEHIRGVDNIVPDALSRNKSQVACSLLQVAEQVPVKGPQSQHGGPNSSIDQVPGVLPERGEEPPPFVRARLAFNCNDISGGGVRVCNHKSLSDGSTACPGREGLA